MNNYRLVVAGLQEVTEPERVLAYLNRFHTDAQPDAVEVVFDTTRDTSIIQQMIAAHFDWTLLHEAASSTMLEGAQKLAVFSAKGCTLASQAMRSAWQARIPLRVYSVKTRG